MNCARKNYVTTFCFRNAVSVFGTPKIMHHDTGREFVNEIVRNVLDTWSGDTLVITGRARHPQSQCS